MIQGFKEFISRGNAVEIAVGMVIGAAFGAVVTSIVDGVINPLVGAIFGEPNFDTAFSFTINGATISFGVVITALVNFLLISLAVYLFIVTPMNKLAERRGDAPEEEKSEEALLLTEIRDALVNRGQTNL